MSLVPLILAAIIILVDSVHGCGNKPGESIVIEVESVKVRLRCRQLRKRRPLYCKLLDLKSREPVKKICRDQCQMRCRGPASMRTIQRSIPPGPYITSRNNSKAIALPDPPAASFLYGNARTNCPHLQDGLKSWHDPRTWPNSTIPRAGSYVTLPSRTKVVIQQSVVEKLGIITVPSSSELILGESPTGINLLLKGMNVKGKLIAGSETCRIEKPIKITLWGTRPSNVVQVVPKPTTKGIHVTGTLSLHGKRYYSTWSRLARTIEVGEHVLLLQRPVNWESGQQIVLTTSIIYDSRAYHQNEVAIVDRVETATSTPKNIGAVVYLQQPVRYRHLANEFYQVEAGLLSRIIVIQGLAKDSDPADPDPLTCRTQGYEPWHFYHNLSVPCTNLEKTGYGGHIMVTGYGLAQVEGVELYRMGQTNVLGRYPMHMHLLGDCPQCYFRDSSVHRSFYRCISVHGTNKATISENVAYNVIGYCYYLEDGVEEDNTFSFNLAAHIHTIGPEMPTGPSQDLKDYLQSDTPGNELTLPADVTASGFYITNVHNYIIGNVASGGWAGFALPVLDTPLGLHKDVLLRPGSASGLVFDGNTAHSTGFWWKNAGAFYLSGNFYSNSDGVLRYNPGRAPYGRGARLPCAINKDCVGGNCSCDEENERPLNISNTKTFLTAGVGLNSWNGLMNIKGFEAYDQRLAIAALSKGFWMDNVYVRCRTGESLGLPAPCSADKMEGSGFYWYDTTQSHIITNAVFQNCGYRSNDYNQFDTSPTRGCGDESDKNKGCSDSSTTFGFVTHSDQHVPEIMQATRGLTLAECGRRFKYSTGFADTVSGRCQNWLDVDGTASGLGEPVIIGSGLSSVRDWWGVEEEVVFDTQGPVSFIRQNNGPSRGLAHVQFSWDPTLHSRTGKDLCSNGKGKPCPTVGYVRHLGYRFSPARSGASPGMALTANPVAVGPVGGFGWTMKLNGGAPRDLNITEIEIDPSHVLLLSIGYPMGTVFTVYANAESWCRPKWDGSTSCREYFTAASSLSEVRNGAGNKYHVDSSGVLTLRIFELARTWTGDPEWLGIPSWNAIASDGVNFAVPRFERSGITLPNFAQGYFRIQADCGGNGVYCSGSVVDHDPNVCQAGYRQVAYDKCCSTSSPSRCTFADGTTST